jgi:hypothetical protein
MHIKIKRRIRISMKVKIRELRRFIMEPKRAVDKGHSPCR